MGASSKIEWTDATWNPIRARNLKTGKVGWHCEHATTGCEFCYAEGFNKRLGTGLPFKPGHRKDIEIFLDEEMLTLPLRWKKPRMIFPNSMTDLFADFVSDEWIDKILAVMGLTQHHTYQPLTKRAARMRDYFATENRCHIIGDEMLRIVNVPSGFKCVPWPFPNVWLGVSTERQQEADERIPDLLLTPAAVRFISAEPLLGPINLTNIAPPDNGYGGKAHGIDALSEYNRILRGVMDWVIVGGESGPDARPMHPDWARSLRDQCDAAGVKHFFKQWGRWSPTHPDFPNVTPHAVANDGTVYFSPDLAYPDGPRYGEAVRAGHDKAHLTSMYPIGKANAGRLLDGIEHNGFPELVRA
jgi:protein gp37